MTSLPVTGNLTQQWRFGVLMRKKEKASFFAFQINIFIIDVNNNAPNFEEFEDTYVIKEKSPSGTLVEQFVATDRDRDGKMSIET